MGRDKEGNSEDDTLKIIQWNARAINPNLDQLKIYLNEVGPHVIALQSLLTRSAPVLDGFSLPDVVTHPQSGMIMIATYVRQDIETLTSYPPLLARSEAEFVGLSAIST